MMEFQPNSFQIPSSVIKSQAVEALVISISGLFVNPSVISTWLTIPLLEKRAKQRAYTMIQLTKCGRVTTV